MSTLAQLVSSVRRELTDYNERASASDEGDGSQSIFRLPDQNIIGPETVLAATNLAADAQTITDGIVDPPYQAVVSVVGNVAGITGNVVVTGLDWKDAVVTSTIALNGTTVVAGTQKFKTITSIALPALTNDTDDTVTVTSAHSLTCTVADVANTSFTMDFDTGWFEFDSAPDDEAAIVWNYQWVHWSKDDVVDAINYGIESLFPAFYVNDLDTSLSTTSGTYEYELPELTEAVKGVDWRSTSTSPWVRLKRYRYDIVRDGTTAYLRFHNNPATGSLRVHIVQRAARLAEDSDTFADIGLPETAEHPTILFAAYWLLSERYARRLNSDIALATQGEGPQMPEQVRAGLAHIYFFYNMVVQKNRMAPWSTR